MNTREIAILIWLFIIIVFWVYKANENKSFQGLLKSLFNLMKEPLVVVLTTYNLIVILLISKQTNMVDFSFVKDYVIAVLLLIPVIVELHENTLNKLTISKFAELFTMPALIVFLIEGDTFNLLIEFMLVGIIGFIILVVGLSKAKEQYKKLYISFQIALFAIIVFLFNKALYTIAVSYQTIKVSELIQDYFFEFVVWIINIPLLLSIRPLVGIDTKINYYRGNRNIFKYFKYYFNKFYNYTKFYLNKYTKSNKNLIKLIERSQETSAYGGSRISIWITAKYISQEDLIVLLVDAIFSKNQHNKIDNYDMKYPNFVELWNNEHKILAYWEEPLLKDSYKNKKHNSTNFVELAYGIKINTELTIN